MTDEYEHYEAVVVGAGPGGAAAAATLAEKGVDAPLEDERLDVNLRTWACTTATWPPASG